MENIILTHKEIAHKTKRIAYQIFETFVNDEEVILAGIANNGYIFAQKIATELTLISDLLTYKATSPFGVGTFPSIHCNPPKFGLISYSA